MCVSILTRKVATDGWPCFCGDCGFHPGLSFVSVWCNKAQLLVSLGTLVVELL